MIGLLALYYLFVKESFSTEIVARTTESEWHPHELKEDSFWVKKRIN